jgi:hypothetical protein
MFSIGCYFIYISILHNTNRRKLLKGKGRLVLTFLKNVIWRGTLFGCGGGRPWMWNMALRNA